MFDRKVYVIIVAASHQYVRYTDIDHQLSIQ